MYSKRKDLYGPSAQVSPRYVYPSPDIGGPREVGYGSFANMAARNKETKVSLIKQNAAVRRHGAEVRDESIMTRKVINRRVSPLWVEKMDREQYMRRDRFSISKRGSKLRTVLSPPLPPAFARKVSQTIRKGENGGPQQP